MVNVLTRVSSPALRIGMTKVCWRSAGVFSSVMMVTCAVVMMLLSLPLP